MKKINCQKCSRLCQYLAEIRQKEPAGYNAPVPSFGDEVPQLLIVGLAPGRGTNRTGRPFTGDMAGELLYPTLVKFGWAEGVFKANGQDTICLKNCRITNAVKCVPPENKPTAIEINNCVPLLRQELSTMEQVHSILCLGGIAHEAILKVYGLKRAAYPFGHGTVYLLPDGKRLVSSYHCSKYNTSTKRLTPAMFEKIFEILAKRD